MKMMKKSTDVESLLGRQRIQCCNSMSPTYKLAQKGKRELTMIGSSADSTTAGNSMDDMKSWFLANEDKWGENRCLRTLVTSRQEQLGSWMSS
jgi:hypothetical protein